MLHGSHQIKSGYHISSHYKRLFRSWLILFVIILPAIALFAIGTLTQVDWKILSEALGLSIIRLFAGYIISLFLGVAIALAVGSSKYREAFLPFFDVLQNVPSFALIPVFVLAFGYSSVMVIVFVATSVIWPILFYTLSAISGTQVDLNDAATVFGARGWKRVVYYFLPLSIPSIVTGSIVGLSIGWEAVIGVEIIGHMQGIGTFLSNTGGNNAALFTGIVAILFVVFVINRLMWRPIVARIHQYGE